MTVLEGSAAWFAARAGIPTCSHLSEILSDDKSGKAPGKPYWTLINKKVWEVGSGQCDSGGTGWAAQRGTELEPVALAAYAIQTGETVEKPGLVFHPRIPNFAGTPDGIVRRTGGLVQVKCPADGGKVVAIRRTKDLSEYVDQIQGEMSVTGAPFSDLVVFDDRLPPDMQLTIFRLMRDEEHINRIEKRVQQFNADLALALPEFRGEK